MTTVVKITELNNGHVSIRNKSDSVYFEAEKDKSIAKWMGNQKCIYAKARVEDKNSTSRVTILSPVKPKNW
jgi:hypothetical protein